MCEHLSRIVSIEISKVPYEYTYILMYYTICSTQAKHKIKVELITTLFIINPFWVSLKNCYDVCKPRDLSKNFLLMKF